MLKLLRPAIAALILFTILTGVIYPFVITAVAQVIFPSQANGSLIVQNGQVRGSTLIGQSFSGQSPSATKYFWSRLSATSPVPYNAAASSGSNLGPSNPALVDEIQGRIKALHDADPGNTALIPVDLVTSSGSGLDPDISPAAAEYQVGRVARARNMDPAAVRALVAQYTTPPFLGIFGDARVNVLQLNLALDAR